MWIYLAQEKEKKLIPIIEKATIGSAASNKISLEGKGVRTLHGQFFISGEEYLFKDFLEKSPKTLRAGSSFQIGSWQGHCGTLDELWILNQSEIVKSFKAFIEFKPHFRGANVVVQGVHVVIFGHKIFIFMLRS